MKTPECPVFHPTLSEVRHETFESYVERIEADGRFAEAGIAKIVAPLGWHPRRAGYEDLDITLPRPIRQHATGRAGLFRTVLIEHKKLALEDFRAMAEDPVNAAPKDADAETLERKYWKNVALNPPLYGADVPGTLFDERCHGWTLRRLPSMLSRTLDKAGYVMPGVNQPYLYFGSWRSTFAWHTEDMDLHSVNFLHTGASKQWYVVPPSYRQRFERLMRCLLGDLFCHCPEFMRHKELLVSPALLAAHNIPVVKVTHNPREFVVVYPGAYHSGFNHGYNVAESVNFATKAWLPIGAKAGFCECRPDSVRIDMRLFVDQMPPKLRQEVEEMYLTESESEDEESEGEGSDSEAASSADEDDELSGSQAEAGGESSEEEEEEEDQEEEEEIAADDPEYIADAGPALSDDEFEPPGRKRNRSGARRGGSGGGSGRKRPAPVQAAAKAAAAAKTAPPAASRRQRRAAPAPQPPRKRARPAPRAAAAAAAARTVAVPKSATASAAAAAGGRAARPRSPATPVSEAEAQAQPGAVLRSRSGRLLTNFINHAAALLSGRRRAEIIAGAGAGCRAAE